MYDDALATSCAISADRIAHRCGAWLRWVDDLESHSLTGWATSRIYDALGTQADVSAVEIAAQAMRDKGLNPDEDRKMRTGFAQRFLTSLHDLRKNGKVECIGVGKGVRWRLVELGH